MIGACCPDPPGRDACHFCISAIGAGVVSDGLFARWLPMTGSGTGFGGPRVGGPDRWPPIFGADEVDASFCSVGLFAFFFGLRAFRKPLAIGLLVRCAIR